jgi:sugar phosphate isomerase/epimerase
MNPAISINTLSLRPAPFGMLAERVARIGAGGISPDLDQVTAFRVAASVQAIQDSGLKVATLTHRAFAFATPEEATAGRERLLRTIDIAGAIGAETITLTTGGRGVLGWPEAAERFAEAMAPCAQAADQAGIALGIEPTSHLYADVSIAHRLSDTVILARKARIGVTIDLFACWIDADIEAAIGEACPLTRVVQVSDYIYGERGLPCRAVPGDGAVPLERLLPAIVGTGFRGWFDLEIIGPRLQQEGEETGLRRAAAAVGKILAGER